MSKGKKYSFVVEPDGDNWKALITRQISSRKSTVSKEQSGFASQEEAEKWAAEQLVEFQQVQNTSNQRHSEQRSSMMEIRRQRSSRRADKTAKAKQSAAQDELKDSENISEDMGSSDD